MVDDSSLDRAPGPFVALMAGPIFLSPSGSSHSCVMSGGVFADESDLLRPFLLSSARDNSSAVFVSSNTKKV